MASPLRAWACALGRSEAGASLVEFALAAPVLALLVSGMIDLGEGLSQTFSLQQAVDRSLELLQASPPRAAADEDGVDYSYLVDEAAAAAGVGSGQVTLTRWVECDGARQSSFDSTCESDEATARYVRLTIEKNFEGRLLVGSFPMSASGAVRVQ
jgi:Flp pilus assembly protein TadG